jgi:hypothetical protein
LAALASDYPRWYLASAEIFVYKKGRTHLFMAPLRLAAHL